MAGPGRDPDDADERRVRHLSGPLAVSRFRSAVWVVVLGMLLGAAHYPLHEQFLDESWFLRSTRRRYQRVSDGSDVIVFVTVAVVLLRRPVLRILRSRSRILDDAQHDGGWRAAASTALLNGVYVLMVAVPGRWAVTTVLTAFATGSDRFRAPDEVVSHAVVTYVDRATGVAVLAMALHGIVVHLSARGRRRLGVPDGRLTS